MQINRKWIISKTLIVLLVLLSPLIEGFLIRGGDRYKIHQEKLRKLDYIGETIYQKAPPIDFLFVGPSSLWASVNAGLIQSELRKINQTSDIHVQNFGHNHFGTDLDYIMIRDLIENRGVKTIFLGMPPYRQKNVHRSMRYIWNPLTHSSGLSFKTFATLYSEKLLDSIPNLVRFYISPAKVHPQVLPYIRSTNGSLVIKSQKIQKPIQDFKLQDVFKSPTDKSLNAVMDYLWYQEEFVRAILKLTNENKVRLVFIFPPPENSDSKDEKFKVLTFNGNERVMVNYIGLSKGQLFPDGDPAEMKKFYSDQTHTNSSGSEYFTRSLIQPLQEIYETTNH